LGDIGKHFPDTDMAFKDADSRNLLRQVVNLIEEKGYRVGNIDCTIIAQKPKLKDYIEIMRKNIASDCNVDASCVNVKSTTEECLGFTGEGSGISAHAVCILE
ncbi:MAG: 2-C-methyl-D-erythritol 2,4-cyclodiphosphate synthase, partial [Clostridia bacterium]|nr:2-C-methyl-D-erythritol 2,4-cyclodiphosphate synthase [Clostridia bacterium]